MRIDLFEDVKLTNDTNRLKEQIASRSGSVKDLKHYNSFIKSLTSQDINLNPRILDEYANLRGEDYYSMSRYRNENGVITDLLMETELLGFFDDNTTPEHTSVLDLTGICPSVLEMLSGGSIKQCVFNSRHIRHMYALENFCEFYAKEFYEFPLIGLDPYLDLYALERYQDVCLETGNSTTMMKKESRKITNYNIIRQMIVIGTYASQIIARRSKCRTYLRTFSPTLYILKSDKIIEDTVELYCDNKLLFIAGLHNIDFYTKKFAMSGGYTIEFKRNSTSEKQQLVCVV